MGIVDRLLENDWITCPECGSKVEWDGDTGMWTARLECCDCGKMISWRITR